MLYLFWKAWTGNWRMWVKLSDIDLNAGARPIVIEEGMEEMEEKTWKNLPYRLIRAVF